MHNLHRFTDAQEGVYNDGLNEIKRGRKQSHWMWFIFPQVQGLGFSETSKRYAITGLAEAKEYLAHPVLGKRLIEICNALLSLRENDALRIFGSPDNMKLRSSMTLFSSLPGADPVFRAVLQKFFGGAGDEQTLRLILH